MQNGRGKSARKHREGKVFFLIATWGEGKKNVLNQPIEIDCQRHPPYNFSNFTPTKELFLLHR